MFKRIGVIICEATGVYQTELLKGINSKAHSLGYDVLVFATFVKLCFHENYEYGEKNIFSLINFDQLDGLIIAGDTLQVRGLKEELFPKLQNECKCPIVFIDYENDMGYENITTNDTISFEEIIDHLIDVHGCRNILFYSGSYDVSSTRTRYEGYKNSLQKHNIALNPDFVSFDGNFWIEGGEQIAREIIEGKRPRPDAIAFCGDHMAIGAMNVFQSTGWKIPEDIIITGHDAEDDCLKCKPPITSYTPPINATGANAVIALDAKINNTTPSNWVVSRGRLELGGSCGCQEDFRYTKRIYYRNETNLNYEGFLNSSMMEDLAEADSFLSLLNKIDFFLYLVPEWYEFHLCLCNDWLDYDPFDGADSYHTDGYTDQMIHYIKSKVGNSRTVQEIFDRKLMLPTLYEEHPEPQTFYFLPIHMNKKRFGYSVLSYGNTNKTFDINYMNWTKHVCNALEYFRIQSRLSGAALIDSLTGAYTRAGIEQNVDMLLNHIHDENYRFMVMMADLDRLKTINDTYGHQAGDQAIHEIARVLLSVTSDTEICARVGGDEFVILGCDNYSDTKIEDTVQKVAEKLDAINQSGKFPYLLSTSIGGVLEKITKPEDIADLYKEADKNMYNTKKIHHEKETT
ncbi:MAG: GGDEF domain-containing protein [Lachnospiraceae bacterium]|nr:GGDEF domain-containing protein [Lachnospiraceae bacterium]